MDEAKDKAGTAKRIGKGCLWVGGGLFALIVAIGIFAPEPEPDGSPPEVAEATAFSPDLKADVRQWYGQVLATGTPCDNAMAVLGEQLTAFGEGDGNVFDGYSAAKAAERICAAGWLAYSDIPEVEGLPSETEAEETIETCKSAYFAKKEAASIAAEVMDGDMRPSKVDEMRQSVEAGNSDTMACVAGAMQVAVSVGIDLKEVQAE